MKKLRTINQIPNVSGTIGNLSASKLIMSILQAEHVVNFNYQGDVEGTGKHIVRVVYKYEDEAGNTLQLSTNGVVVLPNNEVSDIDTFYASLTLPVGLTFTEEFEAELLQGAKVLMAQTFGIEVIEIEEII